MVSLFGPDQFRLAKYGLRTMSYGKAQTTHALREMVDLTTTIFRKAKLVRR